MKVLNLFNEAKIVLKSVLLLSVTVSFLRKNFVDVMFSVENSYDTEALCSIFRSNFTNDSKEIYFYEKERAELDQNIGILNRIFTL